MIEYKRLKLRRDITTNWYEANPVLLEGELGYDTTIRQFKIGDGVTEWRKLTYITVSNNDVEAILTTGYYDKEQTKSLLKTALTPIQEELKTKVDNSTYEAKINEIEGQIQAIPDVPTKVSQLENDSKFQTNTQVETTVNSEVSKLATVAKTGSYTDLTNKPTIPTVPTNVSAFTNDVKYQTDEQVQATVNSEVSKLNIPTKTSQLENDSNFDTISNVDDKISKGDTATLNSAKAYTDEKVGGIKVPTKTSQLTNDSGYLTETNLKTINSTKITGSGDIDIMKIIDSYQWWGTQEAYDALTDEQKKQYLYYYIEGDGGGSGGTIPTTTTDLIFTLDDGTISTLSVYTK